ncbi:MAG: methyltransferase domain-containing protein [Acidobacteria bacterium]|nr:methyltransferase domain-containing protein [Acidobacteriota bacterium]MBI3656038.1 methyltransferase domain-containing protein [Acidobacteriota bacterium]
MSDRLDQYSSQQKDFWNVADEKSARFSRIYLDETRSESAWHQDAAKAAQIVLTGIEPKEDWTILEVGCGVGRILDVLRNRLTVRRLIGVDISESMIAFAKERLADDDRVQLRVGNRYDLSMIPSSTVNFAYAVDVFIHIYDVDVVLNYLGEVQRVLKEGGCFRFNVRRFDPTLAFHSSLGGRFARIMHQLGIWSTGKHRWYPGEEAGFCGNQFLPREIKKLVRLSRLSVLEMWEEGAHLWCTLKKPSGARESKPAEIIVTTQIAQ